MVFFGLVIIVSLFTESFAFTDIRVNLDSSEYTFGDIVTIFGHVDDAQSDVVVYIDISKFDGTSIASYITSTDVNGDYEFLLDTSQGPWEFWVNYWIDVRLDDPNQTDRIDFELKPTPEQEAALDLTRPTVVVPKTMIIKSSTPTIVDFTAKAVDDVDGIIDVICEPASGSVFSIGKTEVKCSAWDSSGNGKAEYFFVIVESSALTIPTWVKDVASFWVNDEIDDDGFVQVIDYLIENKVIIVSMPEVVENPTTGIPSWIKTNTEFWVNSQITDAEFATGIEWLIQNGIIQV